MNPEDILVKKAAARDKAAFEKLVDTYKGYVFAIILNFIKDSHQAENVAQEVFLQVYISLPRYRFQGFRTWLGRIATHKAIDWKRKQNRIDAGELVMAMDDTADKGMDYLNPDEELIKREELHRLRALCDKLPDKYRVVISKYYFAGKSYRQISEEEGIAVKTVESRLYRAKHLLKEYWREGG